MFRRKRHRHVEETLAPFVFNYRGVLVTFTPQTMNVLFEGSIKMYINNVEYPLTVEETMRFTREYLNYVNRI